MSVFCFSSREDLREKIISRLDAAEKGARARLFPREQLTSLLDAVESWEWGYAEGDGGHVAHAYRNAASTTYFVCAWYTWKKEKIYYVTAYREKAKSVPYGQAGFLSVSPDKDRAYYYTLTSRYMKYKDLKNQRRIKALTKGLPPCPVEIMNVRMDEGLVLAETVEIPFGNCIIGTPAGWIKSDNWFVNVRSAWLLLRDLGFPVPHLKKDRIWNEKMTAYAAMHVLGR